MKTPKPAGLSRLRPRHMPLRARLTLTYALLFFVAGLVLLGVTYALFNKQLTGGVVLKRSYGPVPAGSPAPVRTQSQAGAPNGDLGPEAELLRRERDRLHAAATTSLITQGGIALLVVGGAAAGLGWLIAGRALAPLHRVTDTARRIATTTAAHRGLHERIALRGPGDEVKELADTFDTMLERLDRSFDGQRRFVSNASHELRTPLTVGRALVEMAMYRRSSSADVKQLGESLLEIHARHERLINGLLLLARSDNEITERAPLDMADIVEHVAAATAQEAKEAGITVHTTAGEASTAGDALLLERLVQNLVENGIRHNTGHGGWIRVESRTRDEDDQVAVTVTNTGPAVPPYEVTGLFEPFRRLDSDRVITAKGTGLGLSIVRSIARAHDGEVTARPRDDGGLAVTVMLPRKG